MLTVEQIERFSPNNAKTFTPQELSTLKTLDNDELRQLADAYPPNSTNGGFAYLVLHDSSKTHQIGQRSTYPVLFNLRSRLEQKQYSILTFTALYSKTTAQDAPLQTGKVQDITANDVAAAPGLTKGAVQELGSGNIIDPENTGSANTGEGFENLDSAAKEHAAQNGLVNNPAPPPVVIPPIAPKADAPLQTGNRGTPKGNQQKGGKGGNGKGAGK